MTADLPTLVLFDLDGTLADTFPDLEWALAQALREQGLPAADSVVLRDRVSDGARAMTDAAMAGRDGDRALAYARFLEIYERNVAVRTTLFEGMDEVLDAIEASGAGLGVVTNKLARFTTPLVAALGLAPRLRAVVSGDSAARAKPHPDPLLLAASMAGVAPERCVYIGDARKDVEAARAAGMPVAVAAYGYLAPGDDPGCWNADALLPTPRAVLDWLRL